MVRTKSVFPLDKNAPIGPKQKLWIELYDKEQNAYFKGTLTREEYEEVQWWEWFLFIYLARFGAVPGWRVQLDPLCHCCHERSLQTDQLKHMDYNLDFYHDHHHYHTNTTTTTTAPTTPTTHTHFAWLNVFYIWYVLHF